MPFRLPLRRGTRRRRTTPASPRQNRSTYTGRWLLLRFLIRRARVGWYAIRSATNDHSPSVRDRRRRVELHGVSAFQRTFEPGDVPVLPELPADIRKHANLAETEALVQRDGGRIRLAHAGDDAMDVFGGEPVEQRRVQRAADAAADDIGPAIDGRLHG